MEESKEESVQAVLIQNELGQEENLKSGLDIVVKEAAVPEQSSVQEIVLVSSDTHGKLQALEHQENKENASETEKSVLETDDEWLSSIARTFRGSIPKTTVLAFGMKNPLVFTGATALDHLMSILSSTASANGKEWHRKEALKLLSILVNDFWLFVPCGLQQRKGWTLRKGLKLKDFQSGSVSRSTIDINDDERSLYRITKDALILEDISTECFQDFIKWFADPLVGIERKEGRLGLTLFKKEDGIFSKRKFNLWLEDHLGVYAQKEKDSIKKMFMNRHVMDKVSFFSCYKLTPHPPIV